ncbi:MAG: cytochrome c oxidase subunit II [Methanomassiliicoccales archaeon]
MLDPLAVSVTSAAWTRLFNLYFIIGFVLSAIFVAWVIYLVVSTRARPGRESTGNIKPGVIPSAERGRRRNVVFLVVFLAVVFFGLYIYQLPTTYYVKTVPKNVSNELVIDVYAQQWSWTFHYPNGYNVTGAETIKNYTIEFPIDTVIVFRVTSRDVMHEFSIPSFDIKVDAYPGVWNTAWTKVEQTGTYIVFCTELCGLGHADMWARLHFVSPSQYQSWISAQ